MTSTTIITTPALLSCLDARSLATVAAISHALRQAAAADALWAPHFLQAFPASEALLTALQARGQSVMAYYSLRMREEQKRRPPYQRPTPEEKEARLRRTFADTYLELQVTHKELGVLASQLISLDEEGDGVLDFFKDERVPLKMKMQLEELPWWLDDDMDIERTATLLRMGTQPPEIMVLAGREKAEGGDWKRKPVGTVEGEIYFEGATCLDPTGYSHLDFCYMFGVNVHQTINEERGIWEMGMSFYILFSDEVAGVDGSLKLKTADHALSFLEYLLKGRAVWRLPADMDMPKESDD